jgi:hypothetical protein
MHADPTTDDSGRAHLYCGSPGHRQLLRRLEPLQLQADLDAQNIVQLREQNTALEDALSMERARGEKHAEALMHIARTCDERVNELKAQHAAASIANQTTIAKLEDAVAAKEDTLQKVKAQNAALKAATAATVIKLEKEKAALEAQVALLQAHAMLKLADIHTAIAACCLRFSVARLVIPPRAPPRPAVENALFTRDFYLLSYL